MIIKKVFNNSVALVEENNRELVVMGNGIAFKKKAGDIVDKEMVDTIFTKGENGILDKLMSLIDEVQVEYLEIADKIIKYAKQELDVELNENIYLGLTDHINYAIIRYKNSLEIRNLLMWEVKKFYKKEYHIGLKALGIIGESTGIILPEDEATAIALHIINAQQSEYGFEETKAMTKVCNNIISIVKYQYGIVLDENSINYNRFITHIRYFSYRLFRNEQVQEETGLDNKLYEQVKRNYVEAYKCAVKISGYIYSNFEKKLTNDEMIYFILHIHRLTFREKLNI